ncbi:hypothetical protein CJU90_3188 [Yarrowia sp. C11]|nr:hypothetical protein CKK34_4636 [Yarrowia sp. E02]KAG5369691.1 hypothetical protein CJU90_3188 [Yarrowia sp. C11]
MSQSPNDYADLERTLYIIKLKRQVIHASPMVKYDEDPVKFLDQALELARTMHDGSLEDEPPSYFECLHFTLVQKFRFVERLSTRLAIDPCKDGESTRLFLGYLFGWQKRERERLGLVEAAENTDSKSQKVETLSDVWIPKGNEEYRIPEEAERVIKRVNEILTKEFHFPKEWGYPHLLFQKYFGYEVMNNWKNGRMCNLCAQLTLDENMKETRHSWTDCPVRNSMGLPADIDPGQAYAEGNLHKYVGKNDESRKRTSDEKDEPRKKKKKRYYPPKAKKKQTLQS